jgi:hypothetical protein
MEHTGFLSSFEITKEMRDYRSRLDPIRIIETYNEMGEENFKSYIRDAHTFTKEYMPYLKGMQTFNELKIFVEFAKKQYNVEAVKRIIRQSFQ